MTQYHLTWVFYILSNIIREGKKSHLNALTFRHRNGCRGRELAYDSSKLVCIGHHQRGASPNITLHLKYARYENASGSPRRVKITSTIYSERMMLLYNVKSNRYILHSAHARIIASSANLGCGWGVRGTYECDFLHAAHTMLYLLLRTGAARCVARRRGPWLLITCLHWPNAREAEDDGEEGSRLRTSGSTRR